jgi:serpin B
LDFSSPTALNTINGWVAQKTHNKIDKIIDNISSEHVMFLINAIYFKGIWQSEFDINDTRDLPFNFSPKGDVVEVPTMTKTEGVPYWANNLFSAIKLSYGHGNYNMLVFLPNEEIDLAELVEELIPGNWETWMSNLNDTVNIDIKLPRLEYAYEIELKDVLKEMGMEVAFTGNANFAGINPAGNLKIDKVKHKSYIKVDEKGTEAAAVTVVGIEVTSVGPQNIQFNVNRPFLYAITEKDTNAILFMGTVKNPKK